MKKCKIIVYEGPDRVGKATQSLLLLSSLNQMGYNAERVEVPVKGLCYDSIYRMLKNGSAKRHPYIFQFIQFMNRFIFQIFVFPFLYFKNDYIIFDRWSASSWVYGTSTGLNQTFILFLMFFMKKPDLTVILNGYPQVQVVRDDYEKDRDLQSRVRMYYEIYHSKFNKSGNLILLNANQEKNSILNIVLEKVKNIK